MGFFSKEVETEDDLTSEDYIRQLEDEIYDSNISHMTHFILSLLTFGLWVIIWIILFIDSDRRKKRLQRLVDIEYRMLSIKNKSDGE